MPRETGDIAVILLLKYKLKLNSMGYNLFKEMSRGKER
jgi:hypothetical protein